MPSKTKPVARSNRPKTNGTRPDNGRQKSRAEIDATKARSDAIRDMRNIISGLIGLVIANPALGERWVIANMLDAVEHFLEQMEELTPNAIRN